MMTRVALLALLGIAIVLAGCAATVDTPGTDGGPAPLPPVKAVV